MNEDYQGESIFGFISSDIRYVFRALLELYSDDDNCEIDFSSLVDGGWCEANDRICEETLNELAESYIRNERIIILTEGSSDISILKRCMRILNPEVVDFYSFMDFNTTNAQGSASSLVSYVKAFIGSGLRNKVIAVFDNDTAAFEARTVLNKIDIPENIKIVSYPDLEFTKSYPTLGPYGIISTDINGLACSIELYLGIDMLKDGNGNLIPVQWKGYNQLLKKYQGEILNKEQILQRYFKLLDNFEKGESIPHDWGGINTILNMIYRAFD
ncbi:HEPN/Toprim-associated domain-containing protein [Paenibacillus sp. CMAA1739]|nr:HEPN/Toprim-associated domain-containing protein [Paenibacillus sp. CMAA1739]